MSSTPIQFINPDQLMKSPAFSQMAVIEGGGSTIYIGGQNAVTTEMEIVGKGDIARQTEFILDNIEIALQSVPASLDNLFKLVIYIKQGEDLQKGFAGAQKFIAKLKNQPVITGVVVAGLAHPDYLVEIEAMAYKPKTS